MICSQLHKNCLSNFPKSFLESECQKQLSIFPKLSNGKMESPSIKAFQDFFGNFPAFHGKCRETHRETPMKYRLSIFPAFHPLRGSPQRGKLGTTPGVSPLFRKDPKGIFSCRG